MQSSINDSNYKHQSKKTKTTDKSNWLVKRSNKENHDEKLSNNHSFSKHSLSSKSSLVNSKHKNDSEIRFNIKIDKAFKKMVIY